MVSRSFSTGSEPASVVIVGGGFAALETALALRALAEDRVQLTLVSPSGTFAYRPAATVEAFVDALPVHFDLRRIACDLDATYRQGEVAAVASKDRSVRLKSGIKLSYDFLVLAVGARARSAVPGALTFRDRRDLAQLRVVLAELAAGKIARLAFAVPSLHSWSLPAYELAFQSALHAARHGASAEILLVTPEPAPLAVFGRQASELVGELLAERGITFVGDAIPHSVRRDGSLTLQFDAPVGADRVVAIPELGGRRLPGVPATWSGFMPTDATGAVEGLEGVYAAGDGSSYPIKQGGIAAQQADRVACTVAAELGATVKEPSPIRVLRARLCEGEGAIVLRTELDSFGGPTRSALEHHESRSAPELKVFGRYLTPYLSIYRSRFESAAREHSPAR